jgi:hypothetical protein
MFWNLCTSVQTYSYWPGLVVPSLANRSMTAAMVGVPSFNRFEPGGFRAPTLSMRHEVIRQDGPHPGTAKVEPIDGQQPALEMGRC